MVKINKTTTDNKEQSWGYLPGIGYEVYHLQIMDQMDQYEDKIKQYIEGQCALLSQQIYKITTSSWQTKDGMIVPHEIGMLTAAMRNSIMTAEKFIDKYVSTKTLA